MSQYSRLQAVLFSFFSPDLYRDVAKRWQGIGFLYFFMVFFIASLPLSYNLYRLIDQNIQYAKSLLVNFPDVTIDTTGVITTVPAQRYIITDPKTDAPLIIFDTSKIYGQNDIEAAPVTVVHNGVVVVNQENKQKLYKLNDQKSVQHLTQSSYQHFVKVISAVIWLILALECFAYFMVLYALVLFFALLAWVIFRILSAEISYAGCIRLGFVAMTPVLIFQMIKGAALGGKMMDSLIFFGWELLLFIPYYIFALYSNRPSVTKVNTV